MIDAARIIIESMPDSSIREIARALVEKGLYDNFETARSAVRRSRPEKAREEKITLYSKRQILSNAATFEPRKLTLSKSATSEDIARIIEFIQAASDYSLFWWGDLLNELSLRKTAEVTANYTKFDEKTQARINKTVEEYVRGIAGNSDNAERVLEAARVCEAIGGERYGLSYEFHREAVAECGRNRKESQYWLAMTEKNKWSVSEMRAAIRKHRSEGAEKSESKKCVSFAGDVRRLQTSISRLIESKPVEQWTSSEVNSALDDLEPLMSIHSSIYRRWEYLNPALPGAP
jgi:hypothetical protein